MVYALLTTFKRFLDNSTLHKGKLTKRYSFMGSNFFGGVSCHRSDARIYRKRVGEKEEVTV